MDHGWDKAVRMALDHFAEFLVLVVIFALIVLVAFLVIDSVAALVGHASALAGTIFADVVGGMATVFLISWYIGALIIAAKSIVNGRLVNYIDAVVHGYRLLISRGETLAVLLSLGFIAGIVSLPFSVAGMGVLGLLAAGAVVALAVGIALPRLSARAYESEDFRLFSRINSYSPNSGIYLYGVVLIRVLPWVGGILQFVGMPMAVLLVNMNTPHKLARGR